MRNILFFGDSLTAGYGLSDVESQSFPALIQKKITSSKLDFSVVNAGVSGDTSAGGLARLDYWLGRPIDVFVLELGINDMLRGIPPQTTFINLEKIINKVVMKFPDAKIALMGMDLPSFISGPPIAQFRALFGKLADKYSLVFVPFFLEGVAGQRHLNLKDGLHPSSEGYKIIAEKVWPVLLPLLKI